MNARPPRRALTGLPVGRFFPAAKVVDLDPCLSKKPLEEKPSQPYSARESLSEVQSLSSFQSESCDDNGERAGWGPLRARSLLVTLITRCCICVWTLSWWCTRCPCYISECSHMSLWTPVKQHLINTCMNICWGKYLNCV